MIDGRKNAVWGNGARWSLKLLALAIMGTGLACCSTFWAEQDPRDLGTWRGYMQSLAHHLSQVFPIYIEHEGAPNPGLQIELQTSLHHLAQTAQYVRGAHQAPNQDPSLEYFSMKFYEDIIQAELRLRQGDYQGSRTLAINSLNYCVLCHSRTASGRANLGLSSNAPQHLSVAQAKYLFAIREYDQALNSYLELLKTPPPQSSPKYIHENLVAPALTIAIRIKGDPVLAERLIAVARKNRAYRHGYASSIQAWRQSLQDWKREPVGRAHPLDSFGKAEALWRKGQLLADQQGADSAWILWLRASILAHQVLEAEGRTPRLEVSEALFLAAQIEDRMRLSGQADLREYYYERCIQTHPHSEVALRCWSAYQQLMSQGSGQENVSRRLRVLRNLAQISSPASPWDSATNPLRTSIAPLSPAID